MKVQLIAKTAGVGPFEGKTIDEIIAGTARVSTKKEGDKLFQGPEGLLRYMLINQHWSPFEQADLTFEIETSMPIAEQLLRHKSATFQKYSGRYSVMEEFENIEMRFQAETNRQSSTERMDDTMQDAFKNAMEGYKTNYEFFLANGAARECARMALPLATRTRMYMKANIRTWITLLNVRLDHHAQKEVRELANAIKEVFIKECPVISAALFNFEGAEEVPILDQLVLRKYGMWEMYNSRQLNKDFNE